MSSLAYLLVDDDEHFRERLKGALTRRGETVHTAGDINSALKTAQETDIDRAVIDLRLKGESGLELLKELCKARPEVDAVVLTGYGSIATTQEAIRLGAKSYLTKPCELEQILSAFEPHSEASSSALPVPSLAQVEWEHMQRVIQDCGGNITRAAKALGLDRRSLQRRLAKAPKLR